jgi:hypothetical protein
MTSPTTVIFSAILCACLPALAGDIPVPQMGKPVEVQSSPRQLTEEEKGHQLAFVRAVVKTPTNQLDAPTIQGFLHKIAPNYLPEADRQSYFNKREQLLSGGKGSNLKVSAGLLRLQQMNGRQEAKKKPAQETPEMLLMAGYIELKEAEVAFLVKVTKCSTEKLPENSTFRLLEDSSSGKKVVRYFIHPKDPVFILVANHRNGRSKTGGSSFFGSGGVGALCH